MLWEKLRSIAGDLLIGQALSALLTVTSVCSKVLADRGVAVPTAQSAINYVLLFLVFMGPRLARAAAGRSRPALALPWWRYALIAVADVEGNFLVVKAFQLTSFTSAMLLDAFAIPCVMGLGCLLLAARYRPAHFAGAAAALLGLLLLVASDAGRERGARPAEGDALVLAGAALYACSNAGSEAAVRATGDAGELLGAVGLFGAALSAAQAAALGEAAALAGSAPRWPGECWAAFAGFGAALFALTAAVPRVLRGPGAVVLNLGLLTSDFYALAVGSLAFGDRPSPLYAAGFLLVVAGLVVYTTAPPAVHVRGAQGGRADEEALRAGGEGRLPPSQSTAPSLPQLQAQS
eukprot:tig00020911_g15735.t1